MNSTELSEAARYDLIARSGAFDEALYCRQLPGEALQGLPPLLHYMRIGEAHGLRPNADFDPAFYARTYALAERGAGAVLATHLLAEEPADRPTNAEQRAGRLAELGHPLAPAGQERVQISYCIPVMNRSEVLLQTLPETLHAHAGMARKVEFIVLCFDRTPDLPNHLNERYAPHLASGLLRVETSDTLARWHFGRAKNAFAPFVRGLMMSSLDADNYVSRAETEQVLDLIGQTDGFFALHHFSGTWGDGTSGRLTLPAAVYRLCGYDEALLPRQFDEMAAILRALVRFPFLPFYCLGANVFEISPTMAEFYKHEGLANPQRVLAPPKRLAPLDPRGADYTQTDPGLRWAEVINGALTRHDLSRQQSYRASMAAKARWGGRQLLKASTAEDVGAMIFEGGLPSPKPGIGLYACLSGPLALLPRFIAHHLAIGVSHGCLIAPPGLDLSALPVLPPELRLIRACAGSPDTMAPLWLETAMRLDLQPEAWALVLEPTQLLQLPRGKAELAQVTAELDAGQRSYGAAVKATVLAQDDTPERVPQLFQHDTPCPRAYAGLRHVRADFGANAGLSWKLDAAYHLTGRASFVRSIALVRNRPALHLVQGLRSLHPSDGTPPPGPEAIAISRPLLLHDHSLRLEGIVHPAKRSTAQNA